MGVYKRSKKAKFYWTEFIQNGQRIQESTKCTNREKAKEYESHRRSQLSLGRIGIVLPKADSDKFAPLGFGDEMQNYITNNRKIKESTRRRYQVASKALTAFFDKVPVESIDFAAVERFRNSREKQHKLAPVRKLAKNPKTKLNKVIKPATVNRELILLSGLFRYLIKKGKVSSNPVTGVDLLKENNIQDNIVNQDEFRAYIIAASQPLRDVAIVMFETGMRPGEIFNLRKRNIKFTENLIDITEGKTDNAPRKIPMSENAERVIAARYDSAEGDLLFPGGKNADQDEPIVKLTNSHLATIRRAGLKSFRLYDLRHTFATEYIAAGGDLLTLAAILGHSKLATLQRYGHPSDQHKAAAIQKLNDFRNSQTNVRKFRKTA